MYEFGIIKYRRGNMLRIWYFVKKNKKLDMKWVAKWIKSQQPTMKFKNGK